MTFGELKWGEKFATLKHPDDVIIKRAFRNPYHLDIIDKNAFHIGMSIHMDFSDDVRVISKSTESIQEDGKTYTSVFSLSKQWGE